jgi:hypothetical protein
MTAAPRYRATCACGPLDVQVRSDDAGLVERSVAMLSLFDARWEPPRRNVRVEIRCKREAPPAVAGAFLTGGRIRIDARGRDVRASTTGGLFVRGVAVRAHDVWCLDVPGGEFALAQEVDFEHLLELALATGWQRAGWVAVHAGALERDGRCIVLCARSNGGKSTLSAALVRDGWNTLGDDKVLLRVRAGRPELAALAHTFNLDPAARQWLTGIDGVDRWSQYSAGTVKRRVPVSALGGAGIGRACPTHVLQIVLTRKPGGLRAIALERGQAAALLLRQIVIPRDRTAAGSILRTAALAGSQVRALRVEIGLDADAADWSVQLERALR